MNLPDSVTVRRDCPPNGFYDCWCVFDAANRFLQEIPSRQHRHTYLEEAGFFLVRHIGKGEFLYQARELWQPPKTKREKYEQKLESQLAFF